MRTRAECLSWGVALVGGPVLGYAFGTLSVALGLHPGENATPILVLSFGGVLLGIAGVQRKQAGTGDAVGRPPLITAILGTAIGATIAMFSDYSTEDTQAVHLPVLVHIVRTAMVFIPISIGVPVGLTIRLVYRAIQRRQSGNEHDAYCDGPGQARVTSAQSMFQWALRGAAWGAYAWLAVLIGSLWTIGMPVFMGVLKWDSLLQQPDYSFYVLFYFVMGLPFATGLGGLIGIVCARFCSKRRQSRRAVAKVSL